MLSFEEYASVDAVGWAERIRLGEVTPREVVDAAITRAEQVNPAINAFATKLFEQARSIASAGPTGPLAGVPWVIKDLFQTMPGVPVANGSRAYADVVGDEDSELVKRYRRAGLVILGTSTSPELALSGTTESTLYGVTRNPWNLDRTSGGSSGGASALVAAGVVPAAHASDGGGSIRGPASCCGLFGLKPSRGRVPVAPDRSEGWLGCSVTHAVTRSVRDSAALLDATHGSELGSRYVAPPPRNAFAKAAAREPGRLRIAFHWRTHPDITPDPACIAAVEDAAALCASLGHEVENVAPEFDYRALAGAFGVLVVAAIAATVRSRAAVLGRKSIDDLLEETTREFATYGQGISAVDLLDANDAFMAAATVVAQFQRTFDVILTPTMGRPPVQIGSASLMQPAAGYAAATMPFNCFASLQNMTGQPAMNVPLYWADGLPIGVQFAGRIGEEELLFSLAHQLEIARPWCGRRPRLTV